MVTKSITVSLRPAGEAVWIDGVKCTSPTQLWGYLHSKAAREARSPLEASTFVRDQEEINSWLAKNEVKRPVAKRAHTSVNLDDLDDLINAAIKESVV